jgi:putative ABC transport system substrate-binding protein
VLVASNAWAQPRGGDVPRVGYAVPGPAGCPPSPLVEAFLRGLRDRGHVMGQTIVVDRRCYTTGDELRKILAGFVDRHVDVIFTGLAEAVAVASQATKTIPIVGFHADPVGAGVAVSLARPGGNVTGISSMGFDVMAKRIELLKEIVPTLSTIATLRTPTSATAATWDEAGRAVRQLGITLYHFDVRTSAELERTLEALGKARPGAVVAMTGGAVLWDRRQRLIDWALRHRVPTAFVDAQHAREGALMSYGTDLGDVFYRLASYVDRIVKGAKPGDLPIEQPTRFQLAVNLKTAKALGLTIPPSVLLRADEVVQ